MARRARKRLRTSSQTNDVNAGLLRDKSTGNGIERQDLNLTALDSKPGSSGTTIEHLPTEVLLQIFKELEWNDLLNKTSRVCRRWREISTDYSVWMDKRISAQYVRDFEKILTTVPVLDELDLTDAQITKSTLNLLLKSTTRIRKVIVRVDVIDWNERHLLVPVLRHLSPNLKCLHLEGLLTDLRWSNEECILGPMPKLKSLKLRGCLSSKENINRLMPYSPILEKLDLQGFGGPRNSHDNAEFDAAPEMIIRNRETLKELYITDGVDLCSVAECRRLTLISIPIEYVHVVSHLPNIESLSIICTPNSLSIGPEIWCRPKNLKELILLFRASYNQDYIPFLRDIQPPALTLHTFDYTGDLKELLSPQIKRLTIQECSRLDCMRYLSVLVTNKSLVPKLEYLCVPQCIRVGKGKRRGIFVVLREAFPSITIETKSFRPYWLFP